MTFAFLENLSKSIFYSSKTAKIQILTWFIKTELELPVCFFSVKAQDSVPYFPLAVEVGGESCLREDGTRVAKMLGKWEQREK